MKQQTHAKNPVAVIIPNFNGEAYIENCLNSLKHQTMDAFDIIVVDDASKDRSLEILKGTDAITLIENAENSGFARSINNGIRAAQNDFVLLLNNDVVVERDFVEKLYAAIKDDPKIFSVSSRMVRYYERDKIDDTGDFYNIFGWAYKRGDGKPVERYNKPTSVFSTCAGAGIYRRDVLNAIGLFDERYFAYLEDVDVSWRGRIAGYKNRYAPTAVCYHIGSATTAEGQKYSAFKVKISARNNIYNVYKNMPLAQLIVNFLFLVVGFAMKGILFEIKGFGQDYRAGIKEGLKNARSIGKTPFKFKNIGHYIKLEAMMIGNVFRYLGEKLCR